MRRFFEPASAPAWLKPVLGSLRAALGDIWDVPVRPFQAATAALPAPSDYPGGLAWNLTSLTITWSDGASWIKPQPLDDDLTAIAALGTTGLLARTGGGAWSLRSIAGTANEVTVTNGGGVLGAPTISLPSALTFTGKTVTGGTFNVSTLTTTAGATLGDATGDNHTINGHTNANVAANTSGGFSASDGTREARLTASNGATGAAFVGTFTNHDFVVGRNTANILTLGASAINMASGVALQANGTQVVSTRRTGWGAPTGTATRTTFDTATVTTAQLAERVKALIDDLMTHGLIGA